MNNEEESIVLPEEFQPNWQEIEQAKYESSHGKAAFELLKEATICLSYISAVIPRKEYARNEAILCALTVKVSKILKALVAISAQLGGDRQLALIRELIELLAILNYLLDDNDGTHFEAFVHNSLIVEKQFIEKILLNQKSFKGREKIEASMMKSVTKTASAAGVKDVTKLPSRRHSNWPNSEALIASFGRDLYLSYRAGSSVLHSEWHDLLRHHLKKIENGSFVPNFEDTSIRPQPLYGAGILSVEVLKKYLLKQIPEAKDFFLARLNSLMERFNKVLFLHTSFLDD